jgi:aminoglycoside phosphotransferase (APT) family kinase protein
VTDRQQQLLSLLDYLAAAGAIAPEWHGWRIEPVTGGRNNLLYRARSEHGDYAVKFTMRDDRDRAGSEYRALLALQHAGLDVAPRPVLLEQTRYRQPVVVQTWIEGEKVGVAPSSDADWRALLGYYRVVHGITPGRTNVSLEAAVLTMDSAPSGRARIAREIAHVPPPEQPAELCRLIDAVERNRFLSWPSPPVTLCRCDSNPENFIRRPSGWASVDWEYSGWGDPAFELAELTCHPAYLGAPSPPLDLLVALYDPPVGDQMFSARVQVYYRLMLVWWAARLARVLYEVDRGLDERLAPRSAAWRAETEVNYNEYLRRAMAELDRRSPETGDRRQNPRATSPDS